MTTQIPFYKMNGLGNQIIVADARGFAGNVSPEAAIALANPDAVPFDQLMEVRDPAGNGHDQHIRILNSDGSEAGACGNGTRCVVSYLSMSDPKPDWKFNIMGQTIGALANGDGTVTVDMGVPRFGWEQIPLAEEFADTNAIELQIGPIDDPILHSPAVVNMGNPHAVFWVDQSPYDYDLHQFGPMLENHMIFPERANINLAQVMAPDHIIARTWERGAGLTQACGSGACAVLVSAARKGLTDRNAAVTVPGGDLKIEWRDDNHVMMTGPTEFEFSGMLDPNTGAFSRDIAQAG